MASTNGVTVGELGYSVTHPPTAFTMQELGDAGEGTDALHTIVLKRRALPYRPLTLKGTQRHEITWYPGNPVATLQVLGPTEEDTSLSGVWKDVFIRGSDFATLDGRNLADAKAVIDAVDQMRRRGRKIRVTWDEIIREGIISDFTQTWDRRQDIAWSITFAWVGRGDPDVAPTLSPTVTVSDIASKTSSVLAELTLDLVVLPYAASPSMLDRLNAGLDKLRARQQELLDVTTQVLNRAIAPIDGARRAASTLLNMAGDALAMAQTIEANVAFSLRSAALPIRFTAGLALQAAATSRRALQNLKALRFLALERQSKLTTQVEGDVLSQLLGTDGDDLRKVAQTMFGDSADWRVIAVFNNVRTARISAGQKINIPRPITSR